MRGAMRRNNSASASRSLSPIRRTRSASLSSISINNILCVTARRLVTRPGRERGPKKKSAWRGEQKMVTTEQTASLNARGNAAFRFLGVPSRILATAESTKGAFGMIEHWEAPVGFASPYHTHRREDEFFYVLEGEMAFVCGGKWVKGGPGTFVDGPREIPHGFKVIGDSPARMLLMCTPGGFEEFVLEQTTPIAEPPSPP